MLCVATVFLAPKFDPFFDTLELEITTAAILSYKRRHGLCLAAYAFLPNLPKQDSLDP